MSERVRTVEFLPADDPEARSYTAEVCQDFCVNSLVLFLGMGWRVNTEWHILVYMPGPRRANMQRKAKVFMNNRSQAVRLPKEFQFRTQEVFIRKEGSEVVLSPRPFDWTLYLAEGPVASADFMEGIEDLPMQEREP